MGPLGLPELIVIFVVALIVFGPKKLPDLGKSLGQGLREFKRATEDLKSNWDEHLREAERLADLKAETVEPKVEPKAEPPLETHPAHPSAPAVPEPTSAADSEPHESQLIQNKPIE